MKKILLTLLTGSILTCFGAEMYIHSDFVRPDLVKQAMQSSNDVVSTDYTRPTAQSVQQQAQASQVYTKYEQLPQKHPSEYSQNEPPQAQQQTTKYPLPSMNEEHQSEPPTAFNANEEPEETPETEFEASTPDNVNQPEFDLKKYSKIYKGVTKDGVVMQALEMMKGTIGEFSYNAIMGNNLTNKKIKISFRNLSEIKQEYESFDALGWKAKGVLNIYINEKHKDAPPEAIAALLSHEAIHQDEFASLNEETYAWTLEAGVWMQLSENNAFLETSASPLVDREEMLKKLFIKGNYTNKYIKKAVWTNPGYTNLPTRSPGFEDEDL